MEIGEKIDEKRKVKIETQKKEPISTPLSMCPKTYTTVIGYII